MNSSLFALIFLCAIYAGGVGGVAWLAYRVYQNSRPRY